MHQEEEAYIDDLQQFLSFQLEKRNFDEAAITGRNSKKISTGSGNNTFESIITGESGNSVLPPPIDFNIWAQAPLVSTRLNRCIRTVARNTVGLGWEIVPKKEITKDTSEEEKAIVASEIEMLTQFLEFANNDIPFTSIMFQIKQDEETLGNGYLEITRNNKGEVVSLFHVPSITMRILKDDRGYVQLTTGIHHKTQINPANQVIYFKKLGMTDKEATLSYHGALSSVMNKRTGRFVGEFLNGFDEDEGREPVPSKEDRASELLHFRVFNSIDSYYGVPKHIATSIAIAGNRLAARRNANFFENDAVPRMAVLVSGGTLTNTSKETIAQFFKQGKGVEESNRVLILEVDKNKMGLIDPDKNKPNIDLRPLTIGVSEDANFLGYIKANNEEIRESYAIPQIFFTSDDVNKSSSVVSKKIVDEQEFEPERIEFEYILNHKLFTQAPFNTKHVKLKFKRPDTVDIVEKAQHFSLLSKVGALTPNDIRKEIGKAPYPKDFIFADKPLVISVPELQMGVAPTTLNNPELILPEARSNGKEQGDEKLKPDVTSPPKGPSAPKRPSNPSSSDDSDDREDTSRATEAKTMEDLDREIGDISKYFLLDEEFTKQIKSSVTNLKNNL